MSTPESADVLLPIEPPVPPRWSASARRRLTLAMAAGAVMMVLGVALWWLRTSNQPFVAAALLSEASLYLVPFGAIVLALAWRTRALSPEQDYQPQPIFKPRIWFILIWIVGVVVTLGSVASATDLLTPAERSPFDQALRLVLVSALYVVGAVWVFRWVAEKLRLAWPAAEQAWLRWPRTWLIAWAAVWGAASIVISDLALVVVNLVLNPRSFATATQFTEPDEVWNTVFQLLDDPRRAVAVAIGAVLLVVVVAPLLEEALKALGLRFMRRWLHRTSDGLLLGLACGLGFGVLESGLYLYGLDNWLVGGWLRLGTAIMHGVATSLVGVAYVRSLYSHQRSDVLRGYLRAVAMHATWNGSVVFVVVALGFLGFSPCLALLVGLGSIVLLGLMLGRVLPRTTTAGAQTAVQEDFSRAAVPLPRDWAPMPYNIGWRFVGSRPDVSSILTMPPLAVQPEEPSATAEQPIEHAAPPVEPAGTPPDQSDFTI